MKKLYQASGKRQTFSTLHRRKNVEFNAYQNAACKTALYADAYRITYPALGLASEAGEVAGKVKKVLRDRRGDFGDDQIAAIKDELGDVLWYVASLAADLGIEMDEIAADNIEKLHSRLERGTIQGDGDKR